MAPITGADTTAKITATSTVGQTLWFDGNRRRAQIRNAKKQTDATAIKGSQNAILCAIFNAA